MLARRRGQREQQPTQVQGPGAHHNLRDKESTMLTTLRHRLLTALAGAPIIEDLEVDESIYPLTLTGDIAVRNLEGDVDLYDATAVVNADQSLTLTAQGEIIAYYPASAYEAVAAL
ncbi:hypothetical protein [Corynebacterium sanguinis]|uniref:hypothetical protein n=1 Tax=Corynebacterium sanguinis TaxID=2594913 RepID=UPI0021A8B926|nr:hypothetical protein [Corynebacterium sanguinis]MCT1411665.1 hypothetical protein [Corynebacterium sanguinis]